MKKITITIPTKEEMERERKQQERIYRLERDLIDAGIVDTVELGLLWDRCHEGAWDPIGDYNSIIVAKHLYHFKENDLKDFADDEEKMEDFLNLTKEEFLSSYSYLTEAEYELTKKEVFK